jgi:hypothetical protein
MAARVFVFDYLFEEGVWRGPMRETMSLKGHFRYHKFDVNYLESVRYAKSERFRGRVGVVGSKLNSFGEMQSGRQRERQSKDPAFAHETWDERGAPGTSGPAPHHKEGRTGLEPVSLRLAGGPGHWAAG